MSHFSVVVVGENVERQLAPYHEFECTGEDDEFVQDVDITEEARAGFAKATVRRVHMPDFSVVDAYDDRFYRDFTPEELAKAGPIPPMGSGCGNGLSWTSKDWEDGKGYRAKVHEIPADCNVVDEPETNFVEWIEGWYGLRPLPTLKEMQRKIDALVGVVATPVSTAAELLTAAGFRYQAGRCSCGAAVAGWHPFTCGWARTGPPAPLGDEFKYGYVILSDETGEVEKVVDRTNPNKHWDWYKVGGRWKGFFKILSEDSPAPRSNSAFKGEIDFAGMREDAAAKAGEQWDAVAAIVGGAPAWAPWSAFYASVEAKEIDIEQARAQYGAQPGIAALRRTAYDYKADQFLAERSLYVANAWAAAISPHAIVKDGQWFERGSMGWWGIVSDESDEDEWNSNVSALLADLPSDTLLTIVDCHI